LVKHDILKHGTVLELHVFLDGGSIIDIILNLTLKTFFFFFAIARANGENLIFPRNQKETL
jgi:hypothetical protein